ncbi:hypothetical protein A0H81_14444 [Grifola frondosa]|uniref:Uncharacterized protein n=1 Tax=Grifola frondosa TaxID=5627 RepID=A0A1C7LLW8_GRIFR|nr:hypothetical protein A0H81_14444 [Grifola frondosa]
MSSRNGTSATSIRTLLRAVTGQTWNVGGLLPVAYGLLSIEPPKRFVPFKLTVSTPKHFLGPEI